MDEDEDIIYGLGSSGNHNMWTKERINDMGHPLACGCLAIGFITVVVFMVFFLRILTR